MLCLTTLALALGTPAALAGSYAVSFSGGSYTDGGGNSQPDYDDGGGDYSAGPAASIQGSFTVTCTWVPDDPDNPQADPPPQNVVLDETGYAYWEANGGTTTAGGSCDDGLGDPEVPNTDSLPYLTAGSPQLDNDHYSAHAGGASFSFQRSPSVSSGGDNQGTMIYSVSVDPVTIQLVGPTTDTDGNLDILIGQQCQPSLQGIPCAVSNYAWTVTGTTFQSWNVSSDQSSATITPGSGNLALASPSWYWDEAAGIEAINCMATVTPPAGEGDPFTVTATQQMKVWQPYYNLSNINLGTPTLIAESWLFVNVLSGNPAFEVTAQVGTPGLFGTYGDGKSAWLQLCNLFRSYTLADFPFWAAYTNDQYFLDSAFPYNMDANAGDVPGTPHGTIIGPGGEGTYNYFSDQPDTSVPVPATAFEDHDDFKLHLMYLPPDGGAGTNWVPLTMLQWGWEAFGYRVETDSWPINAQTVGTDFYDSQTNNPPYPIWGQEFGSG